MCWRMQPQDLESSGTLPSGISGTGKRGLVRLQMDETLLMEKRSVNTARSYSTCTTPVAH